VTGSVYFETSVFLDIFSSSANVAALRALCTELKNDKVRIYTSIVTIQEVSVLSFRRSSAFPDNHGKVNQLARIETITKDIALTAAKFEATIIDVSATKGSSPVPIDNRRRKFDCFHLATAVVLGCRTFYTLDDHFRTRKHQLGLTLDVAAPIATKPQLPFLQPAATTATKTP
jgi:predicted nucleic acid-binding protein